MGGGRCLDDLGDLALEDVAGADLHLPLTDLRCIERAPS